MIEMLQEIPPVDVDSLRVWALAGKIVIGLGVVAAVVVFVVIRSEVVAERKELDAKVRKELDAKVASRLAALEGDGKWYRDTIAAERTRRTTDLANLEAAVAKGKSGMSRLFARVALLEKRVENEIAAKYADKAQPEDTRDPS